MQKAYCALSKFCGKFLQRKSFVESSPIPSRHPSWPTAYQPRQPPVLPFLGINFPSLPPQRKLEQRLRSARGSKNLLRSSIDPARPFDLSVSSCIGSSARPLHRLRDSLAAASSCSWMRICFDPVPRAARLSWFLFLPALRFLFLLLVDP